MTTNLNELSPRFANLALKASLTSAEEMFERTPGWTITHRHEIAGGVFLEVHVGSTVINVFGRALYETADAPLPNGFLHTSYWVDDIDQALADTAWAPTLIWGPETIQGSFGTRRIAFFEVLPGVRVELMQDLGRRVPDLAARLRTIGAATLYEAAGRVGALDPAIRALAGTAFPTIAGQALTARCEAGDNLAVHRAVAEAKEGEVLVVDGGGEAVGYLGDVLGVAALARGIVGAVIDGGVRDLAELAAIRFPVWARTAAIAGATKTAPGSVATPIICGGVDINPGEWIVADADGAVVVAAPHVQDVMKAAEDRLAREHEMHIRLRDGEVTLDLLGLRDRPSD